MTITGIYIFKSDAGTTLYSRKAKDVQEDLFSAFLTALKSFFSNFALGGLSSFSSDDYIIYLASTNNVLTALIIQKSLQSERYFNVAFEICKLFYNEYKKQVDYKGPSIIPKSTTFENNLDKLISTYEKTAEIQKAVVKLYKLTADGESQLFDFSNEDQLYQLPLFLAVNYVTKQIFIFENDPNLSSRVLFFANRVATNMNQKELKNQFDIRHVTEPWDTERLVTQINNLLSKVTLQVK